MPLLSNLLAKLTRDHRLLQKFPPYVSLVLIVVGVTWLFLLPLDDNSRHTYISENALLPGQVHAYFGGSEQNVFRAYRSELDAVKDGEYSGVSDTLQTILRDAGLKVATQDFEYQSAGELHSGRNVYGIIQAPRGDATEAVVLVAAWKTIDEQLNLNGVSLALSLARYFKRWSSLSKDIIFLIAPDSKSGPQAWIDAYHDTHPASVQSLPLKSGVLQGAVAIEYPFDHTFHSLHIVYDGVNGQLPNLDLFNTAIVIINGQLSIPVSLQNMYDHDNSYTDRLKTMLRGMVKQGLGYASGAHSCFIPYHVDAITLQTIGEGRRDAMDVGRTVEGLVRSFNNLLEHLHQSFFFYLLMHTNRFVSVGTYLPCAMLVGASFTVIAVALWIKNSSAFSDKVQSDNQVAGKKKTTKTGDSTSLRDTAKKSERKEGEKDPRPADCDVDAAVVASERNMVLPITVVLGLYGLGAIPLYLFNRVIHKQHFTPAIHQTSVISILLPIFLAFVIKRQAKPTAQQFALLKSSSLLLLGLFTSTIATLNFSLSLFIGLACTPYLIVRYVEPVSPPPPPPPPLSPSRSSSSSSSSSTLRGGRDGGRSKLRCASNAALGLVLMNLISPTAVLLLACRYLDVSVETVLTEAAFAWNVWGMWTQVAVWCVWWSAWLCGCVCLAASMF